jgi:DNA modification methylase
MKNQILIGDCRERLKEIPNNSIDSIVTDPPLGCELSEEYAKIAEARIAHVQKETQQLQLL